MVESAMLAGAALAAVLGFAWLALAMDTHWQQVHGQGATPALSRRLLRVMGSLLLAASLVLCLQADHASMAVLVWAMLLAGAAVLIAFVLAWQPQWLRLIWLL
ncbi:MAG: DUF3325 domain-containing protein [Paucibacter sp.]|nr:DUF3325 domain-containing protein [Roseateles sp.]